ncbi:pantoate--beta-alanine ligase [Pantoea sp. SoEX]|uniref:pantoate--beta-alanine ligase n=1 Tax=Pantoea sp. SoEX TaxID=2576763 RepID=UPI001356EC0B|nr:pantoate--beta-alanine ligase [Pantoea sp. SoEX]MXP51160.1 pantoate--beta-alanine ligase [Pantoea sp. SoEX]
MLIIKELPILNYNIKKWHKENKIISLIPTMGNIHDGHLKLISEARRKSEIVIVSIFINPIQFDDINDLLIYPRTLKEDYIKLQNSMVDMVFIPEISQMYPHGYKNQTIVKVPILSSILEGIRRPSYFQGVTTIISKLFNLIKPNFAYFGEKDFQQLVIIRKMVSDMNFDTIIIGVPTVRNKDGLALSSRNNHLNKQEIKLASYLNKVMDYMANQLIINKTNIRQIIIASKKMLFEKGLIPDGLTICDEINLKKLTPTSKNAAIIVAVKIGNTRLIDYKKVIL